MWSSLLQIQALGALWANRELKGKNPRRFCHVILVILTTRLIQSLRHLVSLSPCHLVSLSPCLLRPVMAM